MSDGDWCPNCGDPWEDCNCGLVTDEASVDLAAAQAAERRSKGRLSALDLLTPSDDDRYVPPPTAKRRLRGAGPLPNVAAALALADTVLGDGEHQHRWRGVVDGSEYCVVCNKSRWAISDE